MKYNGSSWVIVGSPGFSAGMVKNPSIAISESGIPYVIYQDDTNGVKATVMKYNGSTWDAVGGAGFSLGVAEYPYIAIDRNGVPYVTYEDHYGYRAVVMKLDTALAPITGRDTVCVGDTIMLSDAKFGGIWSSSDSTTALIDFTGIVTGLHKGVVTISYTKSGYSTNYNVVVDSIPVAGTMEPYGDSVCPGQSITLYNTVAGGTWISLDTSIATITSSGVLTGVANGTVNLLYIIVNSCGTDTASSSFLISTPCVLGIPSAVTPTKTSLLIFPNPTYGLFTLNISSPQKEDAIVIITNILGEKAKELTTPTNQDIQIELDNPPGIYFVSIYTSQGKQSEKLVIW